MTDAEEAQLDADRRAAQAAEAASEAAMKQAVKEPAEKTVPAADMTDKPLAETNSESPEKAVAAKHPATACALDMTGRFISEGIPAHFGKKRNRIVVQVNRPSNTSDKHVPREEMLSAIQDSFTEANGLVSVHSIQGEVCDGGSRAIHMAMDYESKLLGLITPHSYDSAPSVILKTAIAEKDSKVTLTMKALDVNSGKIFWSESQSL